MSVRRAASGLVLLLAGTPWAPAALDLRPALPFLAEIVYERPAGTSGHGRQTFRLVPWGAPEAEHPATLQRRAARRLRRRSRRVRTWAGLLSGFPAWGLSSEVLRRRGGLTRIRPQLRLWVVVPGGFLMEVHAEDPGSAGRRRAETRAARLLRGFQRLAQGRDADPFRDLREETRGDRWVERYTLRFPDGQEVIVRGPVPRPPPPPPPEARTRQLLGRPALLSPPAHPEPFFVAELPGYHVTGGPGFPDGERQALLARLLGVRAGVAVTPAGDAAFPE